jgi:hypothetical protein
MFPRGALRADGRAPLDLLRPKVRPVCFRGGIRADDGIGRVRGRARIRCRIWLGLLLPALFCSLPIAAVPAATTEKYDWITRCGPVVDGRVSGCSVTVTFGGETGAFALVVDLDSRMIGIVGEPYPVRATLRIDKDLPIKCDEWRYCLFSPDQSFAAIKALEVGSLILIDVYTARATFRFGLTTRGYQAGIAHLRAWGYRIPWD